MAIAATPIMIGILSALVVRAQSITGSWQGTAEVNSTHMRAIAKMSGEGAST